MNIHNTLSAPMCLTIHVQSAAGTSDSEEVQRGREMTKKTAVEAPCWRVERQILHSSNVQIYSDKNSDTFRILVQQTDWNQLHGHQHVTDYCRIFEENISTEF